MAKLRDIMMELKAQVGAISAQRSVAPTVVTDNRAETVQNTNGVPKKQSNPTPEQGGGNGGSQTPPMSMHGAGDPDPDDGDDDDDDRGRDLKGGPSCGEKGKGRAGPDPENGVDKEEVVDVMARAIARERWLNSKRPTDAPWVFKNKPHQDIRIWLMAVQDYFERNGHL